MLHSAKTVLVITELAYKAEILPLIILVPSRIVSNLLLLKFISLFGESFRFKIKGFKLLFIKMV